MLEEIEVIFPNKNFQESQRGALSSAVAREFPSVFVSFATDENAWAHIYSSQWGRGDFDYWKFDSAIDELAGPLRIVDDRGARDFALEVLTRCQRIIGRRNQYSQGQLFDRVLRRHRELHDVSKPLVRADYNHALDVWQWTLRLEASASLAVQLAALFHDVERLASEADARVEHLAPDYQQFKDAHARAGAAIARRVLLEAGVSSSTIDRAGLLVAEHERPSSDPEVALLNDADALSFFSLNSSGYADYFGPEQTRKKIAYTWNRMRPAARAKLASVRLREDVRQMLEEVRR